MLYNICQSVNKMYGKSAFFKRILGFKFILLFSVKPLANFSFPANQIFYRTILLSGYLFGICD